MPDEQLRIVERDAPTPGQVVGTVAFFDADGNPVEVGGSGSVAWADVTGKPTSFPPVIGTTATTAKAGNYAPSTAEVGNALKAKTQIAALTSVAAGADAAALVTAVNAIIAALKA